MRLIDADEVMRDAEHISAFRHSLADLVDLAIVLTGANAVDAAPVVRCRECKHWKPTGSEAGSCFEDMEPIGGCRWVNLCRKASDFCSYGERKAGDA